MTLPCASTANPAAGGVRRGVVVCALALLTTVMARAQPDEFEGRATRAVEEAAAQPQRGLEAARALRAEAMSRGRLDVRLAADDVECRILTDQDASQAVAVADAGIAAAGPAPTGAVRTPWLRLRTCRAGMLFELAEPARANAELEEVLSLASSPQQAPVRALALLERGVHRSRSGQFEEAQRDLIAACEVMERRSSSSDRDLCLLHLAGHYRRLGEVEESLRLLQPLREQARRRGAAYDESIYAYTVAQIFHQQRRWPEALEGYEQVGRLNAELGDRSGQAYAENGQASVHLRLGQPVEALAHAERGLALLDRDADPRQFEQASVTRAEALVALGRAADAVTVLDGIQEAVRRRHSASHLVDWLRVRAQALNAVGRGSEAYASLNEAWMLRDQLVEGQLSEQSARLRMQFHRARDAQELAALRQLNEQGQRLRQTQAVALTLGVVLLVGVAVVTVRKVRQARQLQRLATTDELTGVANRRALLAFAEQQCARRRADAQRVSLLMVDVDHFKRINDTHGHAVGDQVLRHVAQVLGAGLRAHDRLGRVGGEEFVAVLPETELADALQVAERMRAAVERAPLTTGDGPGIPLAVSIGVATAGAGETVSALLARADAALYQAKHAGRNRVAAADPARSA